MFQDLLIFRAQKLLHLAADSAGNPSVWSNMAVEGCTIDPFEGIMCLSTQTLWETILPEKESDALFQYVVKDTADSALTLVLQEVVPETAFPKYVIPTCGGKWENFTKLVPPIFLKARLRVPGLVALLLEADPKTSKVRAMPRKRIG